MTVVIAAGAALVVAAPPSGAVVTKPVISTVTLAPGVIGVKYSQTLAATGGTPMYAWRVSSGALPVGLFLQPWTGEIQGSPQVSGSKSFTIAVSDSSNPTQVATKAFTIKISPITITNTTATTPKPILGVDYSLQLQAVGGFQPLNWTATGLPAGLTVNHQTGVISGRPTVAGTRYATVRVTDQLGKAASRALTFAVVQVGITSTTVPNPVVGVPYSTTLTAAGGIAPYGWTAGVMPAGLTVSPSGVVSGTPTTAGVKSVTITVADSSPTKKKASLAIKFTVVAMAVTTAALPAGEVGLPYSATLTALGGSGPRTWSVVSGALPAGVTLNAATGALSGTPTAAASGPITVQVADSAAHTAQRVLSLLVLAAPVITTRSLLNGIVGQAYSTTLAVADARPGTWQISSGSLPPGLSLVGNAITGTTTTVGKTAFTITFTDGNGISDQAPVTIAVSTPWTSTQAPLPADENPNRPPGVTVQSFACGAPGVCAAVVTYNNFGDYGLETLSNGVWTAVHAPVPAGASNPLLGDVSCSPAGSCVAVGEYTDGTGTHRPLIETLAGGVWTPTTPALPAGAKPGMGFLDAVSCPASGACIAMGQYLDTANRAQRLIETQTGGGWVATSAPEPANFANVLLSFNVNRITCPAVGWCLSTGLYTDSTGLSHLALNVLSGGQWSATEAPVPPNTLRSTVQPWVAQLSSISCAAPGSCAAVGEFWDVAQRFEGLLLTLSGGTWAAMQAPLPVVSNDSHDVTLNSVSCPAAGSCVAVGTYEKSYGGPQLPFIETLSGSTWTAIDAPLLTNTKLDGGKRMGAVSCAAVGQCSAVGSDVRPDGRSFAVVETLAGGSWAPTVVTPPANAKADPGLTLAEIACEPTVPCIAAGTYQKDTTNFGSDQLQYASP